MLAKSSNFGLGDATQVCRSVFTHIKDMRALVQIGRHRVYNLLDTLMTRHRRALRQMGGEFVKGYCDTAEGEKDPRNVRHGSDGGPDAPQLSLLFAMNRVILIEFDVAAHIEALFDICFCYFPIVRRRLARAS